MILSLSRTDNTTIKWESIQGVASDFKRNRIGLRIQMRAQLQLLEVGKHEAPDTSPRNRDEEKWLGPFMTIHDMPATHGNRTRQTPI